MFICNLKINSKNIFKFFLVIAIILSTIFFIISTIRIFAASNVFKTNDELPKKDVYTKLAYLKYAPILFVSALTGQRIDKLFPLINSVNEQNSFRANTSMLNSVIEEAITLVQPPSDKGRRLKIYYATQVSTRPPTFVVFCNNAKLFHFSYQRYIENQIRKNFGGLEGTPVRILIREKNKED